MIKDKQIKNSEDEFQLTLLKKPIGEKNSGYVRYSAAMYFFNKGLITEEILEVYRICCKFDNEDPLKHLK